MLFYYLWKNLKTIWMRIQKRHTYVLPRTSFKSLWLLTHFGSVYYYYLFIYFYFFLSFLQNKLHKKTKTNTEYLIKIHMVLIIEGVMTNQDTPWKNIFFISSKDVMTIKNQICLKFNFIKGYKHFSIWFRVINYHLFPPNSSCGEERMKQ